MVAHPIQIRGACTSKKDPSRSTLSILQLREQDFIDRLFNDLATPEGRQRLQADMAATRTKNGVLRLYQPVHRVMHVALVDVSCALPGEPRLDPNRIVEAGVVVRRVDQQGNHQGWMKKNGEIVGWRALPTTKDIARFPYDPDPKLRKIRRLGRNAPVLKMLTPADTEQAAWQEDYDALFKAPPDICKAAGKTYLYGVIPLSSAEHAEGSESIQAPPFSKADIRERMPALFKAGGAERKDLPETNMALTADARKLNQAPLFFKTLEFLAQGIGLFTDAPGTEQLRKILESIPLEDMSLEKAYLQFLQKDTKQTGKAQPEIKQQDLHFGAMPVFELKPEPSLGGFLRQAFEILIGQPEDETAPAKTLPASITLPKAWPTIPSRAMAQRSARVFYPITDDMLLDAIYTAMTARWNTLQQVKGRYEQTDATYVACAFIRVRDTAQCPPRTLWTDPSELFEIVPWYESGDQPPVKVALPDIDRKMLSNLKPNVSFKVPPSVQKFMENINLDDLIAGDKPKEGRLDFGMICGFNIPIITLCAFIVLSIFLSLLNILFWWLPFVKICIPFPKKGG